MSFKELLIFNKKEIRESYEEFFKALEEDRQMQKLFINNPIGTLKDMGLVVGDLSDIDSVNRLFFALLSNESLSKWIDDYEIELEKKHGGNIDILKLDANEICEDFAKALLNFMDLDILMSILKVHGANAIYQERDITPLIMALKDDRRHSFRDYGLGKQYYAWFYVEVVVAVALAIALTVVLTQIDATPFRESPFDFGRTKYAALLDVLSSELKEKAKEYRESGKLRA